MTSVTPKKAADAINANGQHLHTTDIDFLTGAATQQAVAQAPTNKAVAT